MGGGLRDSKIIALSLHDSKLDPSAVGLEEITDVDLDRFDKRLIVGIALKNSPTLIKSVGAFPAPFQSGFESTFPGTSRDVLRIDRQPNGLYTLRIQYGYGEIATESGYRMVFAIGDSKPSTTKTTEVPTMAINGDSPISAANFKAVVEKLMGGGISLKRF